MTPVQFQTAQGTISGISWQAEHSTDESPVVLALHGWLDNSATYVRLAPVLQQQGFPIIAIDSLGHGHSDWLGEGGSYYIWESVAAVYQVIQQLQRPVHLLGHSMGAACAAILLGSYPDAARSLTMLDAIGPMISTPEQAPTQLRKGIDDVLKRAQTPSRLKYYSSIDKALEARTQHDPALTPECIRPVIERNLQAAEQGYHWRTDPRLRYASKVRLSEDMVQAFFKAITCPVHVVRARESMIPQAAYDLRLPYFQQATLHSLAGHHHFHLDEETHEAVAESLLTFYREQA